MKKILNLLLLVSFMGVMLSCSKSDDEKLEVKLTSVTLDAGTASLEIGKTKQLTATVLPQGVGASIVWTTSAADIATVSATGLVTAVKEGKADITAKVGELVAKCVITVTKGGGVDPVGDIPNLEEIFKGKLTVIENTSGGWWKDVDCKDFEVTFKEKVEEGIFIFMMKGFWYPQMEESGSNSWAKQGDVVKYYEVPVTINVKDPKKPTYTVGDDPESGMTYCILTVNEGVEDKQWWIGFESVEDKAIEIDYEKKTMEFYYNVSAGDNGKWNLEYDFILSMSWE